MGIIQFLRILWARRVLALACTIFTVLGALLVVLLVPPRYVATSRVMLAILKPDPVTGLAFGGDSRNLGAYVETQRELVKDYQVTAPVVDRLGWLSDPQLIEQYQRRPKDDNRDFRRWLTELVAERTSAELVSGTIFEISFRSPSPVEAKLGAEVLRQSFMDYTVTSRRQDATRNANWYLTQAQQARNLAETAELAKAAFERQNGILMQGDSSGNQQDVDSARLAALVSQAAVVRTERNAPMVNSTAALQLASIDAEIAQNATRLGPNHPEMQQLRARRALVANVAAQEQAQARSGAGEAAASVGAMARAVQEQKARVIGQRDKIERLRQLQSEVDLRREQYRKTAERAAELTLEAGVADSGMSSLGVVVTPEKPAFPDKPLILGGALGLGIALGLALSIFVELMNRRVRGIEDLDLEYGFNCLSVVTSKPVPRRRRRRADVRQAQAMGATV